MTIGIVSAAYIAAAVLFILSLGGLSGQESAKRAVWYGIVGMALAVVATVNWFIILVMVVGGSGMGYYLAARADDGNAATGRGPSLLRRSRGYGPWCS